MNSARAVIGANFGDEGKGLMTDYLVTEHQSDLVIRFNGGAQAGHTVQLPDGRRHVFSHFGSGSFAGAATLLSRFFIVNPMIFTREYSELAIKLPENMDVKIDANAPVTTPFDMLLNQLVEQKRGESRHGSCGLGIGETIERGEKFLKLTAQHLTDETSLIGKLLAIRDTWVEIRKQQLGLDNSQDHILKSDVLIENYLNDVRFMIAQSIIVNGAETIQAAHNPVFEGAQGLLLDQDHEFFPHVTRSNTGIKNMLALAAEASIREVEVYYMTRAYLTRHGAGPLMDELPRLPWKIVDETNISNDWQGSLRFANLNVDQLKKSIFDDLKSNYSNIKIKPRIAITCLDQVSAPLPILQGDRYVNLYQTGADDSADDLGDQIARAVGLFGNHFKSFGPRRSDVVDYIREVDAQIERESHKRRKKQHKICSVI